MEKVTTRKKSNLILNVDGCIAVCFVDLMENCGVRACVRLVLVAHHSLLGLTE